LPGSTLDWLVQSLMFVICVATSGLRDVCFMFLFNGSMFPFSFRVLVTLISVYTFSVCYFCGFVTFDLNIFLHLIKKKKVINSIDSALNRFRSMHFSFNNYTKYYSSLGKIKRHNKDL